MSAQASVLAGSVVSDDRRPLAATVWTPSVYEVPQERPLKAQLVDAVFPIETPFRNVR